MCFNVQRAIRLLHLLEAFLETMSDENEPSTPTLPHAHRLRILVQETSSSDDDRHK